ncbi:hypothetical protein GOP47_0028657 [Adiantum capillus-veneris]|nr:hypothetical protein GOP47_0028657 [Adiantum capillus-veneris]
MLEATLPRALFQARNHGLAFANFNSCQGETRHVCESYLVDHVVDCSPISPELSSLVPGLHSSTFQAMTSTFFANVDSLAHAQELQHVSPHEAIAILRQIIKDPSSSSEALRIKEQSIFNLSDLLSQEKMGEELRSLLTELRHFFSLIPKAKTAKIVRGIIDAVAKIPGTSQLQISLCREMVEWTRAEKRTFLRQRVEARLAALLMETRTAANAIYVPPAQQGTIDLQSGILHAEEKDYKTAFSYFFEAFEAFSALDDPRAIYSLKYMLLCKIMTSQADDVGGLISSKAGLKYTGVDLDAMKAVAEAYSKRSLKDFEKALSTYEDQLGEDPIVHRHISSLYDTLLEQNLCRLIEPFSRVEISHISELIGLPMDTVESKLSQMILDKKFAGTLDQGAGCLIVFDDSKADGIFTATLDTISNISKVVDSLYLRSAKIMA